MTTIYRVPGAVLTEREHRVPLDHARPDGPSITVFTREVAAPGRARTARTSCSSRAARASRPRARRARPPAG